MSSRLSIVDVDMSVDLKIAKVHIFCGSKSANILWFNYSDTGFRLNGRERFGEEGSPEMAFRKYQADSICPCAANETPAHCSGA